MAKYSIEDTTLQGIADAIRSKTGGTEDIIVANMAEEIGGIAPPVEQATPTITVNSSTGLITATATQTAGYVAAGTKSATKQLAFQAAQTITPGTSNKTIAANTYLGGVQTIKGDANLVAGNIKKDTSIFGVTGTYEGEGSGGDTSTEDGLVTRRITSYTNSRVTEIGSSAFYYCTNLTTVNFPSVTTIGSAAFYHCESLTTASFPVATTIGGAAFLECHGLTTASFPVATTIGYSAFYYCDGLTTVNFPVATTIGSYAFYHCTNLTTVSFPSAKTIGSYAFEWCENLTSIYLKASTLCSLKNSNAFSDTGITSTTGSIFVPASLVSSYKNALYWRYFSNRIFAFD